MIGKLSRPVREEGVGKGLHSTSPTSYLARELIRRRWTYPAAERRRGLDPEVVDLVLRLARDNPR
jgi:hypothetical protein